MSVYALFMSVYAIIHECICLELAYFHECIDHE